MRTGQKALVTGMPDMSVTMTAAPGHLTEAACHDGGVG